MSSSIGNEEYCPTTLTDIEENESFSSTEKEVESKRKRTSVVWNDFKLVQYKGNKFAKCNHCGERLGGHSSNGTSHLKRHRDTCAKRQIAHGKQRTLSIGVSDSGAASLGLHKFDMETIRKCMAKCTIMHGLPFSFAEYEYHNDLLKACNSRFVPFSRKTLTKEVQSMFKTEKMRYQGVLNNHVQRVSLTFDMWSSQQTLGYLCLTAQYIDTDWQLHSHMLNFMHVPPPHNAICISDILSECITKWEIQLKLFSITADNCSTNDSGITLLRRTMERKNNISFPLRGEYFHIRCGAHIINLMVQDGMNDMVDTISKISDSVKYVRGSPKRLHGFKQCVKAMGLDGKKSLNYDVPTRWNSTFIMLRDALLFKDVFQHLASCDPSYACLPSEDEWFHAFDLCQFLKVFYDATNLFSTSKQVTSNLVFEEVLSIYHHLRRRRGTSNEHMRALICKMQEKFDKYFKSYNILFAIAVVLDPKFKLSYLKYLLDDLDKPDAMVKYEVVENILHELYVEYRNMYNESDTSNMRMDNAYTSTMIATEEYRSVARFGFKTYFR
ncbi:zinc finger BED domain-containing protein RICESLEEPER 2-like [Nymphaea colorata]|nr:zinc finger BED domain-containing protein RICESLEEPER 2-like [Nymphaea colorata]